jgi:hypothetical protein
VLCCAVEWNGNGMEWNGMEWNGMDRDVEFLKFENGNKNGKEKAIF